MSDPSEKLSRLVTLALRAGTEDEARTAALMALRFAAKHSLVIHAVASFTTGPGYDRAKAEEARRASPRASEPRPSSHVYGSWGERPPYCYDQEGRVVPRARPGDPYRVVAARGPGVCDFCSKTWQVGHPVGIRAGEPPVHAWCAARSRYRRAG